MKFLSLFTLGKFNVCDFKYYLYFAIWVNYCCWYHYLLKVCCIGYFVLGKLIFSRKYWPLVFEKTWYPHVINHKTFYIDALIINMR